MAALTACGGGGGQAPSSSPATSRTTSSSPESSGTSEQAEPSASSADNQHLLQAGETAQGAVADSTVVSIETDNFDTQWEVEVVTSDGTKYEAKVSAEGTDVTSGPDEKSDDADDKTEHRELVDAAALDYREAVDKVTAAVPGRITELELDTDNGATVWEADVVDSGDTKHEVKIDAGSGEVVTQN